jgi:lantibiotic transport system permease protein
MEYLRSLQSEVLKIKGSRIPLITVAGGLLLSLVFTLRAVFLEYSINISEHTEVWERLFSQNSRGFLGFIIPIGAMLICALVTQIEYRNNNWKQVHTTPQKLSTIFLAKFTILIVLTIAVFAILNVGVLLHGTLPCLALDGTFPTAPVPYTYFFMQTVKCIVLTLPIIAFQYLLSLHFKNFMVAFGVGLTVYVGSMPGIRLGAIGNISPYSFVLKYFDQVITTTHCWLALAQFVVLFVASYILYKTKGDKG